MMRIAVLILAYREALCLAQALRYYNAADIDVFIHLDAKADIAAYKAALQSLGGRFTIIPTRHNVFWGGFNMVRAELALIAYALANTSCDRFVLASDDSFPIKSPSEVRAKLSENVDRVSLRRLQEGDPFLLRYKRFFFLDHSSTSLLGRPIESSSIDEEALDKLRELESLKLFGKKVMDLYYGSQWWGLRRGTASAIYETMSLDYQLMKSFEFSAVPDEMCLQSLVGSIVPISEIREGTMYADWQRQPRPYVFSNPEELIYAQATDFLFARKIAPEDDMRFLEFASELISGDER